MVSKSIDELEKILEVNTFAQVFLTQHFYEQRDAVSTLLEIEFREKRREY